MATQHIKRHIYKYRSKIPSICNLDTLGWVDPRLSLNVMAETELLSVLATRPSLFDWQPVTNDWGTTNTYKQIGDIQLVKNISHIMQASYNEFHRHV
jgi:hypothetical protein